MVRVWELELEILDRINNAYLEKQIEKEGNNLGYLKVRSESVGRVEQVYNEQINKGLNKYIGGVFNPFRELSNNPESLAARTLVKESAEFLSRDFQRVDKQLTEIKRIWIIKLPQMLLRSIKSPRKLRI